MKVELTVNIPAVDPHNKKCSKKQNIKKYIKNINKINLLHELNITTCGIITSSDLIKLLCRQHCVNKTSSWLHSFSRDIMLISLGLTGSDHPDFTTVGGLAAARPDKWTVTLSLSLHLQGSEESAAFQLLPTQTFPQIKGSFHHCVLIRGKR